MIETDIKSLRKDIRQKRRQLDSKVRLAAENNIYQQIKQHKIVRKAQNIALFLSFDGEVNTTPIIEYLWKEGKSVYLPIVNPSDPHSLIFSKYERKTSLIRNKFGILEPEIQNEMSDSEYLDIIFTPLVAFDSRNYRIGMGGGFYDRFLGKESNRSIYTIGLAFQCQYINFFENQYWDIKLQEIIVG